MIPYLIKYRPELIVLGGNISKASSFFLPVLNQKIQQAGLEVEVQVSELMEDAAIIGSAKLFDADFWCHVKTVVHKDV